MLFAIIAAVILIADQWLKYWVTVNITLSTGSQELIPGVVKLVNIHNSGAAFGLLDNVDYARWIFLAVTAVFVVVIAVLLVKRVFDSRFAVWCEVLFLTGALGNCIDRVFSRLCCGHVQARVCQLRGVQHRRRGSGRVVPDVRDICFLRLAGDDDEDDEPIKVRPMPRSASADPVDDFADIFGISTKAAEQPAEAQPLKPEESKLPPMHDAFWDDFGPAQRTAAPKPAEKAPEAKPKSAADAGEDFSIEDILAEFKDL